MTTTKTRSSVPATIATIKAYQDKVAAQVQEGKAKLEQLEAKARAAKAQTEIAAIKGMNAAKQNIGQKLQDLKTTHDSNVPRAKADINADVLLFKAAIDAIGARLETASAKNDASKNTKKKGEQS